MFGFYSNFKKFKSIKYSILNSSTYFRFQVVRKQTKKNMEWLIPKTKYSQEKNDYQDRIKPENESDYREDVKDTIVSHSDADMLDI